MIHVAQMQPAKILLHGKGEAAHRLNHSGYFCPRFKHLLNNFNLSGSDGHGKKCIILFVGNGRCTQATTWSLDSLRQVHILTELCCQTIKSCSPRQMIQNLHEWTAEQGRQFAESSIQDTQVQVAQSIWKGLAPATVWYGHVDASLLLLLASTLQFILTRDWFSIGATLLLDNCLNTE